MRIIQLSIDDIHYHYCPYRQGTYDSVKRIGLSFPIKVIYKDNQYYCQDGHKRLSIIHDLIENEEGYLHLKNAPVIALNDGSTRSNDCWRGKNTH